jgi:hypothetical protein
MRRKRDNRYLWSCLASIAMTLALLCIIWSGDPNGPPESIVMGLLAAFVLVVGGIFALASFLYWLLPRR